MEKLIAKTETLLEALPFIRSFYKKTIVIKYGGHAMVSEELKDSFAQDVVLLNFIGINTVIVHGGGPQINKTLNALGIQSTFIDGQRVTCQDTVNVVEMVLGGKVNKEIVTLINKHGKNAVGISGKDGDLLRARRFRKVKKCPETDKPEIIDLGLVGEVTAVNPRILTVLHEQGFIPVVAPTGPGEDGQTLNINADLVAGKIASALRAEKLVLMTDIEGVKDKKKHLLPELTRKQVEKLIKTGVITGGMLPKVRCCLDALAEGAKKAHIIDGRVKHSLLLEIFTQSGIGTQIIES